MIGKSALAATHMPGTPETLPCLPRYGDGVFARIVGSAVLRKPLTTDAPYWPSLTPFAWPRDVGDDFGVLVGSARKSATIRKCTEKLY